MQIGPATAAYASAVSSAQGTGRASDLLTLLGVQPTTAAEDAPVADPTPISQAVLTLAAFSAVGGMRMGMAGVRAYAENAGPAMGGANPPT